MLEIDFAVDRVVDVLHESAPRAVRRGWRCGALHVLLDRHVVLVELIA